VCALSGTRLTADRSGDIAVLVDKDTGRRYMVLRAELNKFADGRSEPFASTTASDGMCLICRGEGTVPCVSSTYHAPAQSILQLE